MSNLTGSRWAPASAQTPSPSHTPFLLSDASTNAATSTTAQPSLSKSQRDLLTRYGDGLKFAKLLRRLKWKAQTLAYSYHRARDPDHRRRNMVGSLAFPMDDDGGDNEAETMFKIDFFEFYVLLERVLVHLLGVLGMVITPTSGTGAEDGLRKKTSGSTATTTDARNGDEPLSLREELLARRGLIGDSKMFHGSAHRFHANVLAALDLPDNPLHATLGRGVVRDYLGIAKEFRNRWKDAEEKPADRGEDGLVGSRYERMLDDLRLEEMLGTILVALDHARPVAEEELTRFAGAVGVGGGLKEAMMELDETGGGGAVGNAPWEAMPDAMEWD